jgi:molybdate transport system substrate-binding protein
MRFISVVTRRVSVLTVAVLLGNASPVSAQSLRVLTAGAFKAVAEAVAPSVQERTGLRVEFQTDTAGGLVKRVKAGEPFDVIFGPPASLDVLVRDGAVKAGSVRPIARVGIGVAVRRGAARPPLETVDQFKELMLAARTVAYIDPASGGTSGIYLDGLFQRLGIADAVRGKAVLVPGGLSAERVAKGEADVAIQQISELITVPGVELLGPLPEGIQSYTVYAAGVSSQTRQEAAAEDYIRALNDAVDVIRARGMTPAR